MNARMINIGLCVVGIALGCAGASALPGAIGRAQAADGEWRCYVTDMLDDPSSAANWRGASAASTGLNSVARHTPAGTVVNLQWNQQTSVTCVKY